MRSIAFYTLGCKVNIYETNALKNEFISLGYKIVSEEENADAYIINTCSVTNMADRKSRQMIHKAVKQNPNAIICVMGCYSQTNKTALEIEGVDIIIGNGNKKESVQLIDEAISKGHTEKITDILDIRKTYNYEALEATTFDHTRAFVKIEDGCDNFCTYCIIPYARGPVRSKNHLEVLNELKNIVKMGYQEVVFAGIHTGRYESMGMHLSDLIEEVLKTIPELKRLRLSSIEINEIDDKLLDLMKNNKVIADHLHLPLQSGTDKILKLMNRRYDLEFFSNKINHIRSVRPDISLTTDVIVGFPYETEEDFVSTMNFIRKIKLSTIHVFPYSMRNGTKASLMPQVDSDIKKDRVKRLMALSNELSYEYSKGFINKTVTVIFESQEDEEMVGHASNYLRVYVPYDARFIKKMVDVKIINIINDKVIGEIIR